MKMNFLAEASDNELLLTLNGFIGQGIWDVEYGETSVNEITALINNFDGEKITVLINSMGGNFYAGVHAYNALKNHKAHITTKIVGTAQSAASVIFCAGDERIVCTGSTVMMHNASCFVGQANKKAAEKMASNLSQIDSSMKSIYHATFDIDSNQLNEVMDEERVLTAAESVEIGIATSLDETVYSASAYSNDELKKHIPESKGLLNFLKEKNTPKPEQTPAYASAQQVMELCDQHGLQALACDMNKLQMTSDDLSAKLKSMSAHKKILADEGIEFDEKLLMQPEELLKHSLAQAAATREEHLDFEGDDYGNLKIELEH